MTSLARRERLALCDTALATGPDAPTLCDPWTVKQLVCHLLVRERDPVAATGIRVGALAGLTERAMARLEGKDFGALVERLRHPRPLPFAVPGVDQAVNTLEFLVHHEDIRRAQDGWEPRAMEADDEATIWTFLRLTRRGLARNVSVPLRIEWDGHVATARSGAPAVAVRGRPTELALLLQGRQRVARVEYDGPADLVAAVRGSDLSL